MNLLCFSGSLSYFQDTEIFMERKALMNGTVSLVCVCMRAFITKI